METDPEIYKLEQPEEQQIGLIIKKDKSDAFKKPRQSLLGLDKLAAEQRLLKQNASRLSFLDSDHDDVQIDGKTVKNTDKSSKQYRETRIETPSYSGGVSDAARDRLQERHSYEKSKGIFASSKDRKRSDREKSYSQEEKRSKYKTEKYSSRKYDSSSHSNREKSYPRSISNLDIVNVFLFDNNYLFRFSDDPKTPRHDKYYSISHSSWDDEDDRDERGRKKSSWDFPTPKVPSSRRYDESVRSDRSSASSRSRIKNEEFTPRATPAHKYKTIFFFKICSRTKKFYPTVTINGQPTGSDQVLHLLLVFELIKKYLGKMRKIKICGNKNN